MTLLAIWSKITPYLTTKNLTRGAILIAIVVGLFSLGWMLRPPQPPIITKLPGNNTVVRLPGIDKLTVKLIYKYVPVEDKAAIEAVMAENAKLKAEVQQLTLTVASSSSTNTGTITVEPNPTVPTKPTYTFDDWRLKFWSDGDRATYTLAQKFIIVNSVGKNKVNVPVNIVSLFEIDAQGARVPVPTTSTLTVAVGPPGRHWYVKPGIQVGIGYLPAPITSPAYDSTPTQFAWSGVVAVPWLKRGVTTATEDTRYAFLTPTVTANAQEATVGVLPVSVNLGNLKHVPLTNLWASPYIGFAPTAGKYRAGFAVTATF